MEKTLVKNKKILNAIFGKEKTISTENTEWIERMKLVCSMIFTERGIACHLKEVIESPLLLLLVYELDSYAKSFKQIQSISDSLRSFLGEPSANIETVVGQTGFGVYIDKRERPIINLKQTICKNTVGFGIDRFNKPVGFDLNKHVHLLIGGTSGSGKSQLIHSIVNSLLLTKTSEEVKFVMIDPKRVELNRYEKLGGYLYAPIMDTDSNLRVQLYSLKLTMEERYRVLQDSNCSDIEEYNRRFPKKKMSHIVLVIEEYADLKLAYQNAKIVDNCIISIAQKGRSAGYHLILATQSPSVKVISDQLKANFANRIALKVTDHYKSNVILGKHNPGAETLLGNGDGLFATNGTVDGLPIRFQGALVTPEQTKKIIEYLNA